MFIFKGATELYFTHYSCAVIIFSIRVYTSLYFLLIFFGKLFFCLSALFVFSYLFEFVVIYPDFIYKSDYICVINACTVCV